jgi:hypothetical protein
VFDPSSRYYKIGDAKHTQPDGSVIVYKRRRFVPPGDRILALSEVVVGQTDRLDLIAFRTLGRPELFWRIADANNAMNPFDLTAIPGVALRIPVPQA